MKIKLQFQKLASLGLIGAHALTWYWWIENQIFTKVSDSFSTCHPFFTSCQELLPMTSSGVQTYLTFYGWVIAAVFVLWLLYATNLLSKFTGFGLVWASLLVLTILKFAFYFSRYDLMGNYHLMMLAVSLCFLIWPGRPSFYLVTLSLQYFLAGLLKLNIEWHSGAALTQAPWLTGELNFFSLGYVCTLELLLVWGLFSSRLWLRQLTFFQLLIFHAFSWHFVGYYYPLTMFCLLVPVLLFVLPNFQISFLSDFRRSWNSSLVTSSMFALLLTIFVLFNLSNKWGDADPALDGQIRFSRLSMLDARVVCRVAIVLEEKNSTRILGVPHSSNALRVRCDPVIFESHLRKYCAALNPGQKIHFFQWSRRQTSSHWTQIRAIKNYCQERV